LAFQFRVGQAVTMRSNLMVPRNNGVSVFVLPPNGLGRLRKPLRFEISHRFARVAEQPQAHPTKKGALFQTPSRRVRKTEIGNPH
jgi:hypothetical protein